MEIIPFIIALILIIIGLIGIILPGLPDLIFIFLGILIYAIWTHFSTISMTWIFIFLSFTLFGYLFDWLGAILGAKKAKSSKWGIIGAVLGGFLGIFAGGILGMIILAILGTIIFEIIFAKKEIIESTKAGFGTLIGMIFGIFLKFVLAGVMIGIFISKVF
jgi:uncharacterized protein YqgC (DUF456 family)